MAEEKNIYQRLMQARIDFAKKNIEPSGYNSHLDFDYLELKDIVPVANKVLNDNKIMLVTSFLDGECVGKVVDLLGKDEPIIFTIPLPDPTKDAERLKLNVVAMMGSQVTYLRRYMLMLVLDIVIADEIDADDKDSAPVVKPTEKATPKKEKAVTVKEEPKAEKVAVKVAPKKPESAKVAKPVVKAAVKSKTPATAEQRAEIKKELTDADGAIDELQKQTLLGNTSKWVKAVPADKEKATNILVKTNGYNNCTRKEADELIDFINGKIAEAEGDKA